jgi:FixJ family two-component response regulator
VFDKPLGKNCFRHRKNKWRLLPMSYDVTTPIVFVIDADISIRESLELCIRAAGWRAETYGSAEEFLARPRSASPSCLILDVNLPDISGLELQEQMAAERSDMPLIFLAAHADIPSIVMAMKRGAMEFMTKPLDVEALLKVIRQAVRRSEAVLRRESQLHGLRTDYGSLTVREREVMSLVVSGMLNKQVGGELGISEITVKAHRGSVMRKMKAASFADLVSMALRLRVTHALAAVAA